MATKKRKTATGIKDRLTELKPLVDEYRELTDRWNDQEEAAAIPHLIGKCYLYANNTYGVGDPTPKWPVYRRVIGRGVEYGIRVVTFDNDKRGRLTITTRDESLTAIASWAEISVARFVSAVDRMRASVNAALSAAYK